MRVNSLLRSAGPVLSVAIVWSCATLPLSAQTTATAPSQPTTAASSAASTWQGSLWPAVLLNGLFSGPSDDLTITSNATASAPVSAAIADPHCSRTPATSRSCTTTAGVTCSRSSVT